MMAVAVPMAMAVAVAVAVSMPMSMPMSVPMVPVATAEEAEDAMATMTMTYLLYETAFSLGSHTLVRQRRGRLGGRGEQSESNSRAKGYDQRLHVEPPIQLSLVVPYTVSSAGRANGRHVVF